MLHGEDKTAAYARIGQIIKTDPPGKHLSFAKENTRDELYMAIFGTNLLEEENIIVVQNYLKDKKLNYKDEIFQNIPSDKTIIFLESGEITPAAIKALAQLATIEVFKPEPIIFHFLDSLSPNSKNSLSLLQKLRAQGENPIIWNISARLMLLILAKLNAPKVLAQSLSGRNLADWQWTKIKSQAGVFSLDSLKGFLAGCLKADLMIKTGKTNLDESTLATFLLIKYLKN